MLLQELGKRQGVVADAVHAQRQGLDPLQDQEGVHGRERRALVAQRHHACAADVRRWAERLGINHAVVADIGLIQAREALTVLRPRELAAIDDRAAHAIAVAAQVLGERMHDDVGAVLDRAQQVGAGHGVVDDERDSGGVCHLGERRDVGDVAQRVADGFAEDRLGTVVYESSEGLGLARIGKAHCEALLREGVRKQVVGAAVERGGRDDVVAGLGDRLDRVGDRRHAGGDGKRCNAAFERRDALFQHVGRRVHDAGVDVARHLQVKQIGPVLGTVKRIGNRLIDGDRDGFGGRIGGVAGVHGQGFNLHGLPRVVVGF